VKKSTERFAAVLMGSAVGLALAFAALEVGLRTAASVLSRSPSHSGTAADASGGAFRILCIGDSNTYGTGVERVETYPAQLQRFLNETPGATRFQVTNLGVPGSNSAQVRNRLPQYLELYDPDLVIVLIGVNDYWNPEETESGPATSSGERLHRRLSQLRTYRLVLLLIEHLRSPGLSASPEEVVLETTELRRGVGGSGDATVRELRFGGARFQFRNTERTILLDDETQARLLRSNLQEMIRVTAEAGVPLVLPTYAAHWRHYLFVNRVIVDLSGAYVVTPEFREDFRRYLGPPREEHFFPDKHPRPPTYAAFARALRDALVRWNLVPTRDTRDQAPPRPTT
jgi:lysophospholipase L1-like esterase